MEGRGPPPTARRRLARAVRPHRPSRPPVRPLPSPDLLRHPGVCRSGVQKCPTRQLPRPRRLRSQLCSIPWSRSVPLLASIRRFRPRFRSVRRLSVRRLSVRRHRSVPRHASAPSARRHRSVREFRSVRLPSSPRVSARRTAVAQARRHARGLRSPGRALRGSATTPSAWAGPRPRAHRRPGPVVPPVPAARAPCRPGQAGAAVRRLVAPARPVAVVRGPTPA